MATGRVIIDVERCKGCELCRQACPQDVLVLAETFNAKGYRPVILLDPQHRCTGCALCAVVCPDSCITVFRDVVIRDGVIRDAAMRDGAVQPGRRPNIAREVAHA